MTATVSAALCYCCVRLLLRYATSQLAIGQVDSMSSQKTSQSQISRQVCKNINAYLDQYNYLDLYNRQLECSKERCEQYCDQILYCGGRAVDLQYMHL